MFFCEIRLRVGNGMSPYSHLVELDQGQRLFLHANKLRPYHARVQMLVNNCSIVYEADEEFGTMSIAYTSPRAESIVLASGLAQSN